jgi:hypothetical protein
VSLSWAGINKGTQSCQSRDRGDVQIIRQQIRKAVICAHAHAPGVVAAGGIQWRESLALADLVEIVAAKSGLVKQPVNGGAEDAAALQKPGEFSEVAAM